MLRGIVCTIGSSFGARTRVSSPSRSRQRFARRIGGALLAVGLATASLAQAAEQRFALLLDTDNLTTTGCMVATPAGAATGIDQVLTTVVTTSTAGASVSRIERQMCSGGTLGAAAVLNPGSWSAGIGNGTNGSASIETAMSLSLLPASGTMRVIALGTNASGGQDVTAAFLIPLGAGVTPPPASGPVAPAPLSAVALALLALALFAVAAWWRHRHPHRFNALLCAGLIVASTLAGAVALDGAIADWSGTSPAVTSAQTGPIDADLLAVYWQADSANLYFRIDADVRPDAATATIAVDAGANQSITLPAAASLAGSATRTPSGVLSLKWSKASGPGTVSFTSPTQGSTTATFSQSGSYVLQLSATDGTNTSSATTTVTVNDAPQSASIVVNAGPAQSITLPSTATLAGSATSTPSGTITYAWSYLSGTPAAVMFADATQASTAATFDQPGDYTLRLTATANGLSNHGDVQIHVGDSGPTLAAVPNRLVALGTTMNLVLAGSSPSVTETLAYSLDAKPAGSALAPTPLIAWTPTNAQLGANTFTARVTDSHGRSDVKSFTVTVVNTDHAPVLDAQNDETVARGTSFARTIHATDADGDALTYALDSGPSGMSLAGTQLSWPTASAAPHRYPVVVRATDSAGLFDVKRFFVSVSAAAAPIAYDDQYQVHVGETLAVAAPGVLGNDSNPMGAQLTANKTSDPDKGTLNSFNPDGSFSFIAPATTAAPFVPVVKWSFSEQNMNGVGNLRVVKVPGRAKPIVIGPLSSGINTSGVRALDGATGTVLWTVQGALPAPNQDCYVQSSLGVDALAVGDIDDSGHPAVVVALGCNADIGAVGGVATRMLALDAETGAIKWLTAPLGLPTSPSTGSTITTHFVGEAAPVIARLKPGQTPSVMFKRTLSGYIDNPATTRACDQFQANSGLDYCTGVIAIDGANGAVRQKWIAPTDGFIFGRSIGYDGESNLIVAPIAGSCTPCIIGNETVWDAEGNVVSNRMNMGTASLSNALAKVDEGAPVIISYEIGSFYSGYLLARRVDGTILWKTVLPGSIVHGQISIGDVDGDGQPDIIMPIEGNLYCVDAHGSLRWVRRLADSSNYRSIDEWTRATIFDLDGDGVAEVIVETSQGIEFLNGNDGTTKYHLGYDTLGMPLTQRDYSQRFQPLVADIDGSGHASVLFYSPSNGYLDTGYVIALSASDNSWRDARPVYNQFSYHVADVNDDGSIPQTQADNFATPRTNVFGNQPQITTPVDPRVHAQTRFTYTASAAGLSSTPATVSIDILPLNRPPVFTSVPPTRYIDGTDIANIYHPHATDPDVGDTVTYALVVASGDNISGTRIDSATGAFVPGTGTLFVDDQTFVISATDSQGATTYQTFTLLESSGAAVMPDVSGQTQVAATSTLTTAGFTAGTITQVYSPVPEGDVVSQTPAAGTSVLLGEVVTLTVSLGAQPVAVPFIVGENQSVATTQLTTPGFTPQPIYVYSDVVPPGNVISQTISAGTLVSPSPTHPIAFVVSLGSGLELQLDRTIAAANQTIAITPIAFDLNDVQTTPPALSYMIVPALTPYTGALPTVSGTTISLAADTRGAFTLVGTDTPGGRVVTVGFVVVPPAAGDGSTNGESFANLAATLDAITALRAPLRAARAANDTTQEILLLKQMVTTWRTLDLDDLRISVPIAPEDGFAPSLDDMINLYHETPTSDDLLVHQILQDAVSDLEAFQTALQTDGTSYANLNALADNFAQRAARLQGLNVSRYGAILNNAQYIKLMSHDIPAFYDALFEQVAQTIGMPARVPQFPGAQHAGSGFASVRIGGGGARLQTSLAELAVAQAVDMMVDKIIAQGSQTYANAKQFAHDIMGQAVWSASAISVVSELKAFTLGQDIYEVASGASLSFREFNSPWSFIEVPGGLSEPKLASVMVVGPDTINAAGGAIKDIFQKLKDGFNYGLDPKNNPKGFKNIDQAKQAFKTLFAKLKAVGQAVTKLQDVVDNAYQTPDTIVRGCIFTSDSKCSQLTFVDGIKTVYSYSPPQGYSTFSGLPVPIIFIVQDQLNGTMYFSNPAFLPTPKP